MAAQTDRNLVDAWQRGGEVDGKKVTDEDLLAHFKDRRDHVAPDDPLWDYYDNLLSNYQFTVDESKMTLKYADQQVGDIGMAEFYEVEAGKHPPDSEIARDLLRNAAAYRERARAEAAAGASRAKAQAYQKSIDLIYDSYQKDWQYAEAYITQAAQYAGIIGPDESLLAMTTSGESETEQDFDRFMALFDDISNSDEKSPLAGIRQALEAQGLGGLTYADFTALADRNSEGYRQSAGASNRFGDPDQAEKFRDAGFEFDRTRNYIKDADEFMVYDQMRRDFAEAWADPGLNPYALREIARKYHQRLSELLGSTTSTSLHGDITNELRALEGKTSGGSVVDDTNQDLLETSSTINAINAEIRAAETGVGILSPVTTKEDGSREQVWSLVAPGAAGDPNTGMLVMALMGGKSVPIWVPFSPLYSQANTNVSPFTRRAVTELQPKSGLDDQIGVVYTTQSGVIMYGIFGADGKLTFFDHPPFKNDVDYGDPLPTGDGGVVIQWVQPGVEGADFDSTGEYETKVDDYIPRDLLNLDQFTGTTVKGRYDNPLASYYDSTPATRLALLASTDKGVHDMLELAGVPEDQAANVLMQTSSLRNDLRIRANRAWQSGSAGQLLGSNYDTHGFMPAEVGETLFPSSPGASPEVAAIRANRNLEIMRQRVVAVLTGAGLSMENPRRQAEVNAMSVSQLDAWLRLVAASKADFAAKSALDANPFRYVGGGDPLSQGVANAMKVPGGVWQAPPLPSVVPPKAGVPPSSSTETPAGPPLRIPGDTYAGLREGTQTLPLHIPGDTYAGLREGAQIKLPSLPQRVGGLRETSF
jgi:hypothetical protein